MGNSKIIDYTDEWRDSLQSYMRKTFPSYSDKYIEYCVDHSSGPVPTKIVVNSDNVIVGCQQYYCTRAYMKGEEMETQWGHDTFLDEEYRKEVGTEFTLMRRDIPAFGIGLTEINRKLSKLLKRVFIKGVFLYYSITPYIIVSLIQKVIHIRVNIKTPQFIKIKGCVFNKITDASEIDIPNGGYWYKGYNELDFIRDSDFLESRFFKCQVHEYYVYSSGNSYFVVRLSSYRGIPTLMLSDFRYNPADFESLGILMRAVHKFARKSHIGVIRFVCGDRNVEKFYRWKLHHKTPLDFTSSYKISPDTTFVICGGDSDAEISK